MTISRFAIKRPVTTTMFFIAVVLLGIVSFRQLPVQLMPDISFPGAYIYVRYRGNSLEETIDNLTKPLEAICASLPDVREIESDTSPGRARVRVQFDFGTDLRFTILDLEEKVTQFVKTLPPRGSYAFVRSFSTDFMQSMLLEAMIQGPEDRETLRAIAEDLLQPRLEAIDGVAEVDAGGYWRDSIDVVIDRDKLVAHNVTPQRVRSRIQQAAANKQTVGKVDSATEEYFVTVDEMIGTIDELRRIPLDADGVVRLEDVAYVYLRQRESDHISRLNGKNYTGIRVQKEAEANLLQLAKKVRSVLKELEEELPPGYSIAVDDDAAEIIEKIIRQVSLLAVIGALLAMVVLILFVRNIRMAAIVFAAIPISVIATFNLMYFSGLTLNIVTLVGLAVGIGMLVDNAIVVLENIFRHFQHSEHAVVASEKATDEVWRALSATTLTNIVVFTPILFAEGPLKLIFSEGALAIIFPISMSLLVALTLVPMVTARILAGRERGEKKHTRFREWRRRTVAALRERVHRFYPYWRKDRRHPRRLYREFYMAVLRSALRHRFRVLLLVMLAIFATFHYACPMINRGTMSREQTSDRIMIFLQMPRGATMDQLYGVLDVVETRLKNLPELEKTRAWGELDEDIVVIAYIVPPDKRERSIDDIREVILDYVGEVPGAAVSLTPFYSESGSGEEFEIAYDRGGIIQIQGAHWEALENVAAGLASQIELIPGIASVETRASRSGGELQFQVDRQRAAMFNLSVADLEPYFTISQRGGDYSQVMMERGDHEIDIRIRMRLEGRDPEVNPYETSMTLDEVRTMDIATPRGGTVPLSELGLFRKAPAERWLERHNSQYTYSMAYMLEPGVDRKKVGGNVRSLLNEIRLPPGYTATIGGQEREIEENTRELFKMLMPAFILVFMVLAGTFESLLAPIAIIFSLLLATMGVLWGLALSGSEFDEMSMLGVLVLAGIAVNNGIVMIDFIMMLRRERHASRTSAIITACRARLRPILMTTLTTVLGLLPLALRSDEEIKWSGLAIVVISGLTVASLLTLIVLPILLILIEDTWALLVRIGAVGWQQRWILYFPRPKRMREKRLEVAPAGPQLEWAPSFASTLVEGADTVASSIAGLAMEAVASRTSSAPAAGIASRASLAAIAPPVERKTGVVVRHVRHVYPVFRAGKLLHAIPSTRYKYGCRPVEGVEALRGVNLTIGPGMFGLLGPNGAGKTTLLKVVTGLIRPTTGRVAINEIDVGDHPNAARAEMGYLPQSFGLHGDFTAREYLDYYSLIERIRDRRERARNIEAILDEVGLLDVADEPVGTFSGGMRQRVGIARLLLTLPRVIIVDEPTAGLDPIERVKFRILLSRLAQDRAVLLSTHIIDDISTSCRNLAIIKAGRIVYDGTPTALVASAQGRIWEYTGKYEDEPKIAKDYSLLYKKAAGPDKVLYRFITDTCDLPNAQPVEPTLEDAYIHATSTRV